MKFKEKLFFTDKVYSLKNGELISTDTSEDLSQLPIAQMLHKALSTDVNLAMIKALVIKASENDLLVTNESGETAFYVAAKLGRADVVEAFLANAACKPRVLYKPKYPEGELVFDRVNKQCKEASFSLKEKTNRLNMLDHVKQGLGEETATENHTGAKEQVEIQQKKLNNWTTLNDSLKTKIDRKQIMPAAFEGKLGECLQGLYKKLNYLRLHEDYATLVKEINTVITNIGSLAYDYHTTPTKTEALTQTFTEACKQQLQKLNTPDLLSKINQQRGIKKYLKQILNLFGLTPKDTKKPSLFRLRTETSRIIERIEKSLDSLLSKNDDKKADLKP